MEVENQEIDLSTLDGILKFERNNHLTFDDRINFLYPKTRTNSKQSFTSIVPNNLSLQDKSDFIKLSSKHPYQCEYKSGSGHHYSDVGSIRTSHPIPEDCEIYYYEVLVVNQGERSRIAVGLTALGTDLTHQPGWDRHTFGYHGDDGGYFRENGYPGHQQYGPTFGTNDVIGCGINFKTRSCFFTKNGKCLGTVFKNMPLINLYPTVGVHSKGEIVSINFGQKPFLYNIKMEMVLNEASLKDAEGSSKAISA